MFNKNYVSSIYSLFKFPTEIPYIFQSNQIFSLDGFRAISIIFVLIAHFVTHYQYDSRWGLFIGDVGVNIFFVISGFLITSLLIKEKIIKQKISLVNFYIRRFLRIFPVAYLFLVVLIILSLFGIFTINSKGILGAFLYLTNFSIYQVELKTLHFWSLSAEEQFYLLFPFLLKFSFRHYVFLLLSLILLIPFIRILYNHNLFFNSYEIKVIISFIYQAFGRGYGLYIGSLCSIMLFNGILPLNFLKKTKLIWLILFCISCLTGNYLIVLFFSVTLLFSFLEKDNSVFFIILNNKYVSLIGKFSYSIYIWQQIFSLKSIFYDYFMIIDNSILKYVVVNLICLFVISYISYTFYEIPILKLKKRFV